MPTTDPIDSVEYDRARFGRALLIIGTIGAIGALVAGVAGWIVSDRAVRTLEDTIEPMAGIVINVAETIDASKVMVSRTTEAIDSIERATRSTARTLESVGGIIDETAILVGEDLAEGLDSAVGTLPGLIDTSRVIDRTMRALSLVGVDYDPEIPLDESLTNLEQSLSPLPDQMRDQVSMLQAVGADVSQISADAGALAAVLLEARIDMMEAERILKSAAENAANAVASIETIEQDLSTYDTLGKVVVVAVTIALLAAASAPLLIGMHYRRDGD